MMFLHKVTTTASSSGAPSIRLVLFLLSFVINPPHQKGNLLSFVNAQTSTICNTKFEQEKQETGSELTCILNSNLDEGTIGNTIRYGCQGLEPIAGISFNIDCTGYTEQSATTTTKWFCTSFSDDYDFSVLNQSFGSLCDDGTEPMYSYLTFSSSEQQSYCPSDVGASAFAMDNGSFNFWNETFAYELTSITSSTDVHNGCRPSICGDIWNEQLPTDYDNGDTFICTTIDTPGSPFILYGCEDGTQPTTGTTTATSNSSLKIYADQQCKGTYQEAQRKERTLFDCIAFGTDSDSFTTLLMNIEESNLVCEDGRDPIYIYQSYKASRVRENGRDVASGFADGTIFRNEFNITLANELYTLEQDVQRYDGWPPSICNQAYIDENPEDDDGIVGSMTRSPLTCARGEIDWTSKTIGNSRSSTTYIAFTCQDNDDDEMADDTPILVSDVSCNGIITITEGNETTKNKWSCSAFAYQNDFRRLRWVYEVNDDYAGLCAEGSNPVFKYVGTSTNVTQSSSSDEINAMLAFGVYSSSTTAIEEDDATTGDGTLDGGDDADSAASASYFKFGSETNVLATMGMMSGAMILFHING